MPAMVQILGNFYFADRLHGQRIEYADEGGKIMDDQRTLIS